MFPEWYVDDYCPCYYRTMDMNMPTPMPMPMQTQQPQQPQQLQQPQQPPSDFEVAPGSPTVLGVGYTQGFLRTQIGKRVKVTFLIGTNTTQDRDGVLTEVGISYIVLRDLLANYLTMADIYSIKFVNIYSD
ncbi:hypothetical protein [Desnuesiella massiliensis]|uniref:hypothetical protein n=1 Tax=Desnuesiella massiliensis TaxID=1650662 RepID=UPI0006E12E0F|nr:hypothetical protein [Desnuesiella massiliensis]